ncbi:hypothetical protein [Noviherbaspirillum galbum]|uniref:Uncharacterized protein n=1 Tax=Noviherbaspirillum galbum TaxID=2709383 RepID=A0A6B3SS47_9BURK|nr:hypothetical protein [Noviherbaspirillum galbum]NEX63504.1 hypothetical protein [Noviherbaspirillum galbum]
MKHSLLDESGQCERGIRLDPKAIFLRTEAGRTEIHDKKCGLTQSERLVLIMVDGVSKVDQIKEKLTSINGDRFSRAMQTLQKKDLITPILLPLDDQVAEELDQQVVERFLHQDALDPITIISFQPEDEFGDGEQQKPAPTVVPELTEVMPSPAIDVAHAKMADELHEELVAKNLERKRKLADQEDIQARDLAAVSGAPVVTVMPVAPEAIQAVKAPVPPVEKVAKGKGSLHWEHAVIALGAALIVGFGMLKLWR